VKEGFSKVEIFLVAFPGDQNIKKASVDLVACVLKAVENAILYFLSSMGKARQIKCFRSTLMLTLTFSEQSEGEHEAGPHRQH
jgi:hypothetical protein